MTRQETPAPGGTAYEKVCAAAQRGEFGAYLSDSKYASICSGEKNFDPYTKYGAMPGGLLRMDPAVFQKYGFHLIGP